MKRDDKLMQLIIAVERYKLHLPCPDTHNSSNTCSSFILKGDDYSDWEDNKDTQDADMDDD